VLIVPSWWPPDGGWFFRDQARFVADAGADVAVAYARPHWPRQVARTPKDLALLAKRCTTTDDDGIPVFVSHWLAIPSRGRLEPAQTLAATRVLVDKVVKYWGTPDLIHAHSCIWAGYAASQLSRALRVACVITEHRGRFTLPLNQDTPLSPAWYDRYLAATLSQVQKVILVGSGLATRLRPFAASDELFRLIPNGVDTAVFRPDPTRREGKPFRFVFVGGLTSQKGVHYLMKAFHKVHCEAPDTQLVFVGEGPERAALQSSSRDLALEASVEFTGQQNASGVRRALQASHAFVLPSQFEGCPVSVVEAMATGLPVIATYGAPPELFPPFAGLRVPFADSAHLASAMLDIMRNYAEWDQQRIREFAVTRYDFRAVTRQIVEVYTDAVAAVQHGRVTNRGVPHRNAPA